MIKKTIFTGFAPNLTIKDVLTAEKFLLLPWNWFKLRKGDSVKKAEKWLQNYFKLNYVFAFDSGRTALLYALKSLNLKEGDEVAVQAYTCIVVINAIKWAGARPVYIDVDNTLNMDPGDLEEKITNKTRAIIIQHTFGVPAQVDKLLEITKRNNLKVVEDCAHSLGASFKGNKLGTFGDIAILSFGTDKVVSCNRGGAIITNSDELAKKIENFRQRLPHTPVVKVVQHLLYFPAFFKGKLMYSFGVGKWILYLAKKLHLTSRIIYSPEKHGRQVIFYPALMPNSLGAILLNQLENLDKVNKHRIETSKMYRKKITNKTVRLPLITEGSIYLRFNILTDKPDVLRIIGKKQGIIFGDWYNTIIAPSDIDMDKTWYKIGSCPNAENFATQSVNLPTNKNITKKDVELIAKVVNSI